MHTEEYIGEVIRKKREERGIKRQDLAEGLMNETYLTKLEMMKSSGNKFQYDCLMQRLGIWTDTYHNYVRVEDDKVYQLQLDILGKIQERKIEEVGEQMELYKEYADMTRPYHQQFLAYAKLLVEKELGGNSSREYQEVLSITNSCLKENLPASTMLTALEALCLFEYLAQLMEEEADKAKILYHNFYQVLVQDTTTSLIQACMLPQVAVILARVWSGEGKGRQALEVCERALACLQEEVRLFGMSSLLAMCHELTKDAWYEECLKALQGLYDSTGLGDEFDPRDLFYWGRYSVVNTTIAERRAMLGLTAMDLMEASGEVCSERTIYNIESGKSGKAYAKILKPLLLSLHLQGELYSDEITYHSYEINEENRRLNKEMMVTCEDEAGKIWEELRKQISQKRAVDKQCLAFNDLLLLADKRSTTEKKERAREILEITLGDLDQVLERKKHYFSKLEIAILIYIFTYSGNSGDYQLREKILELLCGYFNQGNRKSQQRREYLFWLVRLQSYYGDSGRFQESYDLLEELLQRCLRYKDMAWLVNVVSEKAWNGWTEIKKQRDLTEEEKARYYKEYQKAFSLEQLRISRFKKSNVSQYLIEMMEEFSI